MKLKLYILLFFAIALNACDKDEREVEEGTSVAFSGNNAVIRSGNISNVRLKSLPGKVTLDENMRTGEIKVEANQNLDGWLEVKDGSGELRIEGKQGLPASLDLHFHMHPHELRRIVVEGDNQMEFISTPVMDHLELVTEGASELVIRDMKVKHLVSRREGKSRMFLSNELLGFDRDSVYFLASAIQIIDNRYIIYTEDNLEFMLYAPTIRIDNDAVYALSYDKSNPLRRFFITRTHEMVNQGESVLDALELPTLAIASKNEGESESRVWAVHQLHVKGEGESVMYYFGFPAVDQDMKGASRLIYLP